MNEIKLSKTLINDANNLFKNGETPFPYIVIDKSDYKNYDISTLKQELNKNGFDIIDGTIAKEPLNSFPSDFKKLKWFVYQIN